MTELERAAKAEAMLQMLESRVLQLEKPHTESLEQIAVLQDTVKRMEYRINILVAALKEADDKIESLSNTKQSGGVS
jgi:chromosome segregation ATPase